MKRSHQRLFAQTTALARRLRAQLGHLLDSEIDEAGELRDAQVAEASAMADAASELRGGYAKVAQLRGYLQANAELTPEAQRVLGRVWDQLPADDPNAIRGVIRSELGDEPQHVFTEFDSAPLAAASLGQVHGARTKAGDSVAVKVQYPGIADALRDDLAARRLVRDLVGADLGDAVPEASIAALSERLLQELDYRAEQSWLRRFKLAFANDRHIAIPAVYPTLCSQRVLTMERFHGRSLPQIAAQASTAERSAVAAVLFRFAMAAPLRHRLLNLDPNPGNYIVLSSAPDSPRVGFIDFGCCTEVDEEVAEADRRLWLAMIHRDGEALRYAAHRTGLVGVQGAAVFESATFRAWEAALAGPFLSKQPTAIDDNQMRELVQLTWKLVHTGRMTLPPGALLLWRQRLGFLAVLGSLRPVLPMRQLLAEVLDDGGHPVPLLERYP
ncbi:MAG: AarF/ABC1/UbiB kinase family protein [Myxococcales bacterium]|nr:AarF/ABC1/UbiB kinase family protein [Myxococcales bacterium]